MTPLFLLCQTMKKCRGDGGRRYFVMRFIFYDSLPQLLTTSYLAHIATTKANQWCDNGESTWNVGIVTAWLRRCRVIARSLFGHCLVQ